MDDFKVIVEDLPFERILQKETPILSTIFVVYCIEI